MTNEGEFSTRVLLRSEETDGALALIENTVPAGWPGPPLHHHAFDEAFYVLDGELTFQLEDRVVRAGTGTLAFAPGGARHTLANRSGSAARYLLVCTPGGFERYFDRLAAEAAGTEPPARTLLPYPETTVVGDEIDERAEASESLRSPEGRIRVVVRGAQSDGRLALMDNDVGVSMDGPPLHHHAFDETFYVVDGELTFQLEDRLVTRGAGELAFAARGVHHTFANLSGAGARVLILCTPAGFERYFDWLGAKEAGVESTVPKDWPEVTKVGPPIASDAVPSA